MSTTGTDTLVKFLEGVHFIVVNLNDTFAYACADAEQIGVGDREMLAEFWAEHGWYGLVALCAVQRGMEPIKPVAEAEDYRVARAAVTRELAEELELIPDDYAGPL